MTDQKMLITKDITFTSMKKVKRYFFWWMWKWKALSKLQKKTSINEESEPCNNDPGYTFNTCIGKSIFKLTGCTLD